MRQDDRAPLGHQYALAMLSGGEEEVRGLAEQAGSSRVVPDDALLTVKQQQTVWG